MALILVSGEVFQVAKQQDIFWEELQQVLQVAGVRGSEFGSTSILLFEPFNQAHAKSNSTYQLSLLIEKTDFNKYE